MLLGSSKERRLKDRPDFNTRTVNIATIKCRKDPYEILKLTSEEMMSCVSTLNKSRLIAIYDEKNSVRCIFVENTNTSFEIHNNELVGMHASGFTNYHIPRGLRGLLNFKVIVSSFFVLQLGNLAAQMTLQGREGMALCRCIKCNLTQSEWKLGQVHSLLKLKDLTNSLPDATIGQKCTMLWKICPSNTAVPILHCEIGTVNDQLYKKLFRQLLKIQSGSTIELDKRIAIMDMKEELTYLKESIIHLDTDLHIYEQSSKEAKLELMRKK